MMKKFVFGALLLCGLAAHAVNLNSFFYLGPLGEVVYGDGSVVQGAEAYVVVFTASGHEFAGFTEDGQLQDPTVSVVSGSGLLSEIKSEDGGQVKYEVDQDWLSDGHLSPLGCKDGFFELYLLDTRIDGGYANIDPETNLPESIRAWAKPTGSGQILASALQFARTPSTSSGSLTSTEKTVVGSAPTPVPVIVTFAIASGSATVGVTNTVATSGYVLEKASDPAFANILWTSESAAGAQTPDAALSLTDANASQSAAFYRVKSVAK